MEQELERLLSLIIEPVQFSDWAAPIVPVLKSDGRVRICGDYKVTINRAAKLEKYPIPRIEELFATSQEVKRFPSSTFRTHIYRFLWTRPRGATSRSTHIKDSLSIGGSPSVSHRRHRSFKESWRIYYRGYLACVSTLMIFW